ncbi:MAG: HNH endonuclease [Nitrospirales bacterium]|nr:HNH endonuclease [Nitrospirales bacterium]
MGFSAKTRTNALVKAARHCCACHRYKGVKVEVHHIVPPGKGGSDEEDNAIALCFDCHADAGHYNEHHPRGTKFSKDELRAARDAWHDIVKRDRILSPDESDVLYCRYLVCKDSAAFREILAGDLSRLPFKNSLLAENFVLAFQNDLLRTYRHGVRPTGSPGKTYKDLETYLHTFPEAVKTEKTTSAFGYFEAIRTPTLAELSESVAKTDAITRLVLETGVPVSEIACAVGYSVEAGCGGLDGEFGPKWFQEDYRIRPLWGIFLAITNETKENVRLKSVRGIIENPSSIAYRRFNDAGKETGTLELPLAPIPSGSTVLIPLATVLPPLQHIPGQSGAVHTTWLEAGLYQDLVHMGYPADKTQSFHLCGPALRPDSIFLELGNREQSQDVHTLDLTNLYRLDRNFAMGSCPHIFFRECNGRFRYGGELFNAAEGQATEVDITIPDGTDMLIVAELQKELTHIFSIHIDSTCLVKDVTLQENQALPFLVEPGQNLKFSGYYLVTGGAGHTYNDSWLSNEIVGDFLATLNDDKAEMTAKGGRLEESSPTSTVKSDRPRGGA